MTTTEDALLPAVHGLLKTASWPASAENPTGVTVLFGAYRPLANTELVAVTGLTNTTIESREEVITFDVATLINIPGYNELRTWERRVELTNALIETLIGDFTLPATVRATGVYWWHIVARQTSVEPAADVVPGSSGWVGYALLTIEAKAHPC